MSVGHEYSVSRLKGREFQLWSTRALAGYLSVALKWRNVAQKIPVVINSRPYRAMCPNQPWTCVVINLKQRVISCSTCMQWLWDSNLHVNACCVRVCCVCPCVCCERGQRCFASNFQASRCAHWCILPTCHQFWWITPDIFTIRRVKHHSALFTSYQQGPLAFGRLSFAKNNSEGEGFEDFFYWLSSLEV